MKHSVLFSQLNQSKPPHKHIHLVRNGREKDIRLSTNENV